jgi:hypothetical protein
MREANITRKNRQRGRGKGVGSGVIVAKKPGDRRASADGVLIGDDTRAVIGRAT